MITVFMGIQNLRNFPVTIGGDGQALLEIQWVYRERIAGLRTGDQIVEITITVTGPDLFHNHFLLRLA
jgi:hypothetical protein